MSFTRSGSLELSKHLAPRLCEFVRSTTSRQTQRSAKNVRTVIDEVLKLCLQAQYRGNIVRKSVQQLAKGYSLLGSKELDGVLHKVVYKGSCGIAVKGHLRTIALCVLQIMERERCRSPAPLH